MILLIYKNAKKIQRNKRQKLNANRITRLPDTKSYAIYNLILYFCVGSHLYIIIVIIYMRYIFSTSLAINKYNK